MSRPATGEPDRGAGAPTRTTRTREAAGALLVVLALGLAFRVILAQELPGSGFRQDLDAFRFWASNLASEGPYGFYDRPFFHDYTPGYLYALWAVGLLGQALGGIGDLIKVPAILADVALGWVVWALVLELGASRRAALLGAAIVVVNPITWFDSVVWGQVDSVGVVFLLLAVRELWRDRAERSAILAVVAALIKPQLGILVPIVAAVTIRRALFPDGGYGDEQAPYGVGGAHGRTTTGWERRTRGPIRIVTTGLAGFLTAIVLSAPFGLSFPGLVQQIFSTAAGYPYATVNAYNPWALVSSDLGYSLAADGVWICDAPGVGECATGVAWIGPLPGIVVGTTLLLATIALVSLAVARRPDRLTILVGLAILALAFFVVPTRVHERYLFPFFAIGAVLAAVAPRWRLAYALVAVATFANMYVVLTTIYPGNPSISDWLGVGPAIRSWGGVAAVSLVHAAGFGWALVQLTDGARRRLADALRARSGEVEAETLPEAAGEPVAEGVPTAAAFELPAGPGPAPLPVWRERPSLGEGGAWEWFRSRLLERPVRPDRSATLAGEGSGRLDRLDVWLLVVLVVSVLSVRLWRLPEPYQMHFDEVYHARTATEFLQHWRYGISHDIYEWTHPHLAKYAMAAGIVAFADDRVTATSELGVPVRDAAIEARYDDPLQPGERTGDRLHVATGSEIRSYDLATRALVAVTPLPGASAVVVDETRRRLVAGTDAGEIVDLDLSGLEFARAAGLAEAALDPQPLAAVDGPIERLHVTVDGAGIVALSGGSRVTMVDGDSGAVLGTVERAGATQFADAEREPVAVATVANVPDPSAAAATLAEVLGGDAEAYAARLAGATGERVALAAVAEEQRDAVDAAISDGRLAGIDVRDLPRVAVADDEGLAFLVPALGEMTTSLALDGGADGVALVTGIDEPRLYATTTGDEGPRYAIVDVGSDDGPEPDLSRMMPLPGEGSWVAYDEATQQVHVLGRTPEGDGWTVYVVEPHANAVYADARLDVEPVAWAMDANGLYPASDRQDLLVLDAGGSVASVEVGQHAFAWRLPGVIAGVLMAALIYLLARILFRRRSVAVFAGLLVLFDGMLFVQSRIAMNDAYVGLFIVAAYTLFAAIWAGAWRWRGAFWVAMPLIGLLLGLALAAKWVAAYAIGALGILILARSALGRVVLIAGMIVVTTVLGYLAISVPQGQSGGNLTFALIMITLTLAAVVVTVVHPIAWSATERRFAILVPIVGAIAVAGGSAAVGALDATVTLGSLSIGPPLVAGALAALAVVVAAVFWLAGRFGFGPLAAPPDPADALPMEPPAPAARGWLRPGAALGLPVAWMVVSLLAIPLAVYVVSYVPWAFVENHQLVEGWPEGHTGQTLVALTGEMYRYHNTLSSPHAASSPWWAWPFDLKPVWFYQESFAGNTGASIYDSGNLVIWWLGVPALAFVAWQAFRRRSLALGLIAIGFACQWIAWARIDRAAFQYHYYTSLPFVVLALAYFLAELWHGASRRTWLLARLSAAAAVVAPAVLWLLHRPLCGFVRVEDVNPGSRACPTLIPEFVLSARSAALAVVVLVAVVVLLRQFLRFEGSGEEDAADGSGDEPRAGGRRLVRLAATAAVVAVAMAVVQVAVPEQSILVMTNVAVEPVALLVLIPLAIVASFVATARDARRFVGGLVVAIVVMFVFYYPNLSALPLPGPIVNMYQGILPTYVYPFQFPVSTVDRNVAGPPLLAPGPAILLVALTVACLVVAYSAWVWRLALAERRLEARRAGGAPSGGGEALAGTRGEA